MSGGLVLGHILAGASDLVIGPLVIAGGAGMPHGDVVSAGETVVLIIVVLVGVGRLRAAVAVVGYIGGRRWNTASCWWSWCGDVVVASSTSATIVVASAAIVIVALVVSGWRGRRGWRDLDGEECDLLLGCRDGGTKFCHAGECRLMVGIVCKLEVGQFLIEGGFDVIEGVVVGDDVGGAVVSVDTGGARARLLAKMYAVVKCVLSASQVRAAAGMLFHLMRA